MLDGGLLVRVQQQQQQEGGFEKEVEFCMCANVWNGMALYRFWRLMSHHRNFGSRYEIIFQPAYSKRQANATQTMSYLYAWNICLIN